MLAKGVEFYHSKMMLCFPKILPYENQFFIGNLHGKLSGLAKSGRGCIL
jgi:hypothetical protein